jgi:NAD(P)-dependent dehydrogenase (short-subunit alcohol dehydrogenase family)
LVLTQELKDSYNTPSVAGGSLSGRKVIIFGGTGGIGLATVERFLIEGCSVTVVGRDAGKLEVVKDYLEKKFYRFDTLLFDILNLKESQIRFQEGFFDEFNFCVNAIGVYSKEDSNGLFRNIKGELFANDINTNFKAATILTEACIRDFLRKDDGGVIVNIGSINSEQRKFKFTPYGISKYALAEYTKKTREMEKTPK